MAAVLQGLARLPKTSPTFLFCTSAHHNYLALSTHPNVALGFVTYEYKKGVFLPLMIRTRSKPIMVVSAEVVVIIVLSIVTILVDYLRQTSWNIHSEKIKKDYIQNNWF